MREILVQRLYDYVRENNPDLLLQLEEQGDVTNYLNEKVASLTPHSDLLNRPAYFIEEECMNVLTQDLRPSKFNYVKEILEEEFEAEYQRWLEAGILPFEIINLIEKCRPSFDERSFSEATEDDRFLKYLIIGTIGECLEESVIVRVN